MANRIDILVSAKNQASAELKKVQTDLHGVNNSVSRLASGPGIVGALFGVGGVAALTAGAIELAKTASQFKTLENAFNQLAARAGSSGSTMLSAMREASSGMISDAKLVESANRAMMLGVADSAGEMAQLLQVAQARGQAMGLSAEQAFNDLVTGIGRMSPLILDNLGIVTGGQKVFDDYAASIGKAGDELSDTEKKQALFAAVVRDSQDAIATMTEAGDADFQRLKASIDNAKVAIGQLYSGEIIAAAGNLSSTIDAAVKTLEKLKTAGEGNVDPYAQSWMGVAEAASQAGRAMTAAQSASIASLGEYDSRLMASRQNVETLTATEEQLSATTQRLGNDFISVTGGLSHFNANLQTTAGNVMTLTSVMSGFTGQINSIASSMVANLGAQGALGYAQDLTDEARTQAYQWMQAGIPLEQIQGILLPAMLSDVRKANSEIYTTGKGVSTVNSEFSSLASTISGIVSGATGPVAGVNAEDFLPREDEVNENARRLADIMVNGIKDQPWLDEFKSEVPGIWAEIESSGDPQGTAARILKDFQDGLRPELIDKERAKEIAKRALIGDKNTKALVDEIAGELAQEMGVSFAQAQAAASSAFGGGGGSGGGGASVATIKPQIDSSALKTSFDSAVSSIGAFTLPVKLDVDMESLDFETEASAITDGLVAAVEAYLATNQPSIEMPFGTFTIPPNQGSILILGLQAQANAYLSGGQGLKLQLPFGSFSLRENEGTGIIQSLMTQMQNSLSGESNPFESFSQDFTNGLLNGIRASFTTMETASGENMIGALGSMFQRAFVMSATDNDLGAEVAGNIFSQISASAALIEQSGTGAGQRWRSGFMSEVMGLPSDVLNTLAMLLAPLVGAQQQSDASRQSHWESQANPGEVP